MILSLGFHLEQLDPEEMIDYLVDRVGLERHGAGSQTTRALVRVEGFCTRKCVGRSGQRSRRIRAHRRRRPRAQDVLRFLQPVAPVKMHAKS